MKTKTVSVKLFLCIFALSLVSAVPVFAANNLTMTNFINAANYSTLQAAINALPSGGGTVFLPPGTYTLDNPLNLTNGYGNGTWITLIGSGKYNTIITGNFGNTYEIVDATYAGYMTVKDLCVNGTAKCLWLCGREGNAGGGGHFFQNILFDADNCTVGMALMGSEVNRFVNCEFRSSNPNCTVVLFTPWNDPNLVSRWSTLYVGASTTELNMYGCVISNTGSNSIGLRAVGPCANINIHGGYHTNAGLASIYFDGTRGNVTTAAIRDLRIDGKNGQYALYMLGGSCSANTVTVQGCNWTSANDVVRGVSTKIINCNFEDSFLGIQQGTPYTAGPGGHSIFRIDNATCCKFQNINYSGYDTNSTFYYPQFFYSSGQVDGSTFTAIRPGSASSINIASSMGNTMDILNDNGSTRRLYQAGAAAGYPTITNMEPTTTASVIGPKVGDIIMLKDGAGPGLPCLAYYNGTAWEKLVGQ